MHVGEEELALHFFVLDFFFQFQLLQVKSDFSFVHADGQDDKEQDNQYQYAPDGIGTCQVDCFLFRTFFIDILRQRAK